MHSSSYQPAPHENAGYGKAIRLLLVATALALVAAVGHAFISPDGIKRFMFAYVTGYAFVLSLVLGSLFFVMVGHLCNAGWVVVLRRPLEVVASMGWLMAILFIPIAVTVAMGNGLIYYWAQPVEKIHVHHYDPFGHHSHDDGHGHAAAPAADADHAHHHDSHGAHADQDEIILGKRGYLNQPFFLARWAVYLAIWSFLGWFYWSRSVRQDETGDHRLTMQLHGLAGPGLVMFGLSVTLAAFDLIKSIEAHWFSTMFGVYYFIGGVVGMFAFTILLLSLLQKTGRLTRNINTEHYHDLGKYLFGFIFFWIYIAFSQYMLIWYANMPETTFWYHMRGVSTQPGGWNPWTCISLVLLFGHFAIPFAGLLSRYPKRRQSLLIFWAVWMLVMHWVDVVWMVMPSLGPTLRIGLMEIGLSVGLFALLLVVVLHFLGKHSPVPIKDPRLAESLAHENI